VIHMGVRDDDVADFAALGVVQRYADAAGIDSDAIVDDEAGQALGRISVPNGIERAG
jgi:hypothetical protein